LRAELWDKLHFILDHSTDRMMRGELWYDGLIQADVLKKALLHVTATHPVLHSSFRDHFINPHWEVRPYTIDELLTVMDTDDLDRARQDFMNRVILADSNVQYGVAVINDKSAAGNRESAAGNREGRSLLCVMVNHMCMDGRGLITFLHQLALCYNRIYAGLPLPDLETGSREYSKIYTGMSFPARLRAKMLLRNITRLKEKRTFAYTPEDPSDRLQIITQKWDDAPIVKIKETAKKQKIAVNDMLLASYIQALSETSGFPPDKPLTITCMVDNRRHIKQPAAKEFMGLTNHVGLMQLRVDGCGATIKDTIQRVQEVTTREKNKRFFGLHGIPLIRLGYRLPFFLVKPGTLLWFTPPVLGFSNVGVIPEEQLKLGDLTLSDIMLVGPSQFKPHFTVFVQVLRNTLIFTTAVRGNEQDRETVRELFDRMKLHLKSEL
jgi:NRPS condensation-like uncharacterized protein